MSLPSDSSDQQPGTAEPDTDVDDARAARLRSMRSWIRAHRITVIAVVIAVGWLFYTLVIDRPEPSNEMGETQSTVVVPAPSSLAPPAEDEGTDADHNTPMGTPQEYLDVANGFARDFTIAGPDWHSRVSRWVTPELADAYRTTDPHRVPSAVLTDVQVQALGSSVVDLIATYDTGLRLGIRVEYAFGGWKVSTCQPMTTAY